MEEKRCYIYVVFRGQMKGSCSVVGTTDIGRYFNGVSMTEKWLIETARKDFEKLGEYGNIMIHSICELSEDLYNQLTSDL